jgi:DNA-binding transcriptional regulator YhcF (GntR family)
MNVDLPNKASDDPLYQQVADRLRQLITEGTLQPGDRLPSVRKLHNQLSVSISTILEAYRVLEDQGWVQARSQSGYYVKSMPDSTRAEPQQSMILAQVSRSKSPSPIASMPAKATPICSNWGQRYPVRICFLYPP